MNKKLLALAILTISAGVSADSEIKETPRAGVYADTEWAAAHGGPRNDDYISSIQEFPRYYNQAGSVLDGAGVPLGPTRGPNGHFYAATAQAEGNSNLTAFDADGNIIWQSAPWQTGADFDPGGVISAPIVDEDGIIYHSDANQMWAFYPDGKVKWVTGLPDPINGYSTIFDELNLPVKPNSLSLIHI